MRFVLGVLIGFGVGFAGAILLAPEKKDRPWSPGTAAKHSGDGFVDSIRDRVREAMGEAREARRRAEREMLDRYERSVGRKSDEG